MVIDNKIGWIKKGAKVYFTDENALENKGIFVSRVLGLGLSVFVLEVFVLDTPTMHWLQIYLSSFLNMHGSMWGITSWSAFKLGMIKFNLLTHNKHELNIWNKSVSFLLAKIFSS